MKNIRFTSSALYLLGTLLHPPAWAGAAAADPYDHDTTSSGTTRPVTPLHDDASASSKLVTLCLKEEDFKFNEKYKAVGLKSKPQNLSTVQVLSLSCGSSGHGFTQDIEQEFLFSLITKVPKVQQIKISLPCDTKINTWTILDYLLLIVGESHKNLKRVILDYEPLSDIDKVLKESGAMLNLTLMLNDYGVEVEKKLPNPLYSSENLADKLQTLIAAETGKPISRDIALALGALKNKRLRS